MLASSKTTRRVKAKAKAEGFTDGSFGRLVSSLHSTAASTRAVCRSMLQSSANVLQIPFEASGFWFTMRALAIICLVCLHVCSEARASHPGVERDRLHVKSFFNSTNKVPRARCFSISDRDEFSRSLFLRNSRKVAVRQDVRKKSLNLGSSQLSKDPVFSLGQLTTAYYMQTQIGTPPREVLLLVDTGSELTWVQCTSCSKCSPTKVPPFNPDISSSFISEPCSSSVCSDGNLGFQSACNESTGSCSFQVAYLDGSEAYGIIAREIFSLQSWDGAASKLENMIFGCASKDLQNPVDFSSGTLGLNRGSFSFPAQIGRRKGLTEKFSYCFPNRAEHLNASGLIFFGETGVSEHLQYIPLQDEPAIANIIDFYYVDLMGISVEDELLSIPSSAFKIDSLNGNGGTYFDSGTTVSFLVEPAHGALVQAFGRRLSHLNRTSGIDFRNELCYDIPAEKARLPKAPTVTLHFRNNVKMELHETSLWVPLARTKKMVTICLAFVNAGTVAGGGVNVIGNYQQQDYLIEHDLKNSRIGFAPANCVMD